MVVDLSGAAFCTRAAPGFVHGGDNVENALKEKAGALAALRFWYSLFGRAFAAEPDAAVVACFSGQLARDAWDVALDAALGTAAESLLTSVDLEELLDAGVALTQGEYTRVFLSPAHAQVPLWESVYVSPSHSLFTGDTLTVRECYRSCGYKALGDGKLPDDHVSTELYFVAALLGEGLACMQASDVAGADRRARTRARFLDGHPLKWLDDFVARLEHEFPDSPYCRVASSLAAFARADRIMIGG